jgi:glutathione S-transferase
MGHSEWYSHLTVSAHMTADKKEGFKASILLEEIKDAYGKEYTVQAIHLPKGVQKQPWYLELNCNGKIPTIVDHDLGGISVGESSGE